MWWDGLGGGEGASVLLRQWGGRVGGIYGVGRLRMITQVHLSIRVQEMSPQNDHQTCDLINNQ